MSQRVKAALDAALIGEEEDEIEFDSPENLPEFNPYLNYPGDDNDRDGERDRDRDRSRDKRSGGRPESSSRRRNKSDRRKRPGSAARSRGRGSRKEEDMSRNRDVSFGPVVVISFFAVFFFCCPL